MAATADHSMVLQHLSRSHCNAGPTEARIGPGPPTPTSHHAHHPVKVESGLVEVAGVAEVRARPHPQAEDDLELPVCQLRSVLQTPKLQVVANKARQALFSKCSLQPGQFTMG